MNLFRYRGYVYDNETGLYYNSTRYYDPTICRFVNADTTDVLTATLSAHNDKNLFAYCDNNPVSRADDDGEFWNFVIGAAVGAVAGAISTAIDAYLEDGWDAFTSGKTWAKIGVSAAFGAVNGVVAASGASFLVGGVVGAVTGGLESVCHEFIDDGNISKEDWCVVGSNVAIGFVGGIAGGNGAIRNNKYMLGHTNRYLRHFLPDKVVKPTVLFYKMTAKYSKQFIGPTISGVGKGFIVTRGVKWVM